MDLFESDGLLRDKDAALYVQLRNRLLKAGGLYLAATLSTMLLLIVLEGWPLIDAFYMTVITLSTVGYGEIHPLGDRGRLFMSGVMIVNNVIFLYAVGSLTTFFFGGYITGIYKERKLMKRLKRIRNHYIVVGYGRLGKQTARTLRKMKKDVIAIDLRECEEEIWEEEGVFVLRGDGREEAMLNLAGVSHARGLAACLPGESDNLVVIITAKEYNPEIQIVARASNYQYLRRLRHGGARRVYIPEMVAGRQIARELVDPTRRKFERLMEISASTPFQFDEVSLGEDSPLVGQSILEARVRERWGVFIPFIGNNGDEYEPNPDPSRVFQVHDHVWVFGDPDRIGRFAREAAGVESPA